MRLRLILFNMRFRLTFRFLTLKEFDILTPIIIYINDNKTTID